MTNRIYELLMLPLIVRPALAPIMAGAPPLQLAKAATIVAAFVYAAGLALSFFLPEPKGSDLPE